MDQLPTEQEINPVPEDLDGQVALRNFLGKARQQIFDEFDKEGFYYTEDLMFMGSIAFCFYLTPAVDFVLTTRSRGYAGLIHAMTLTLQHRLEWDDEIAAALPDIIRYSRYVLEHYDAFEIDPVIRGDFRPILHDVILFSGGSHNSQM
ncbi:hypothetical protein [Lacunimicrobium album]